MKWPKVEQQAGDLRGRRVGVARGQNIAGKGAAGEQSGERAGELAPQTKYSRSRTASGGAVDEHIFSTGEGVVEPRAGELRISLRGDRRRRAEPEVIAHFGEERRVVDGVGGDARQGRGDREPGAGTGGASTRSGAWPARRRACRAPRAPALPTRGHRPTSGDLMSGAVAGAAPQRAARTRQRARAHLLVGDLVAHEGEDRVGAAGRASSCLGDQEQVGGVET